LPPAPAPASCGRGAPTCCEHKSSPQAAADTAPLPAGEPRLLEGLRLHLGQLPAEDGRTRRLELLAGLAGAELVQGPPPLGEEGGGPPVVLLLPEPKARRRVLRLLRQQWGAGAQLLAAEWLEDCLVAYQMLPAERYAVKRRARGGEEGEGGEP
jgi:hypothetical protein